MKNKKGKQKRSECRLEKRSELNKIFGIILFAFILIIIGMGFVSADCTTWLGTTSTNWSVATNWDGGSVPTSIDCVIFDSNKRNIYKYMLTIINVMYNNMLIYYNKL